MDWLVFGTAGHVDHGKTRLIKALTGCDTDRLKEEKERGISIVLGFAPMTLPNGQKAAIIDVPGHEKFVRQMLSGVAGIDLVIFVIDAGEGVMAQTREHMDILQLLHIKKGLTVLTKIDLVEPDWLALVEEEVREFLQGSFLEDAPIVKVSAETGEGIEDLKHELVRLVESDQLAKKQGGQVRLPVDRAFIVDGFGLVVTGTLWSGHIKATDKVEIQPKGKVSRVRGIQVHGAFQEEALPGQRTALNLPDLTLQDVESGSTIVAVNSVTPAHLLDISVNFLPHMGKSLKNRSRVWVHIGTAEKLARLVLYGKDELLPGETGFAQLQMEEPVIGRRGDYFVLRSYSPVTTIGGGVIIDPVAKKAKRFDPQVLESLKIKEKSSPEESVAHYLNQLSGDMGVLPTLAEAVGLAPEAILALSQETQAWQVLASGGQTYLLGAQTEATLWKATEKALSDYHKVYPLRAGMGKDELKNKALKNVQPKGYPLLLEVWRQSGNIQLNGATVALAGFEPKPPEALLKTIAHIEAAFLQAGMSPPELSGLPGKLDDKTKREVLVHLVQTGKLVKVAEEGMYFHAQAVAHAKEALEEAFNKKTCLEMKDVRDVLGSSRKYLMPLLEYLDTQGFTKRVENGRVRDKVK